MNKDISTLFGWMVEAQEAGKSSSIIIMGNRLAGKTTLAVLLSDVTGAKVITPDFNVKNWELHFFSEMRLQLECSGRIIIDDTNATLKGRNILLSFLKVYECANFGVWCNTSTEICTARGKRNEDIIKEINILSQYFDESPPTIEEGFTQLLTIQNIS